MRKIAYPRGAWFAQCRHLCRQSSSRPIRSLRRGIIANRNALSATWRNGGGIPPPHATALVRSTVAKNGHNPPSFSLRSLGEGGATALYRATKDVDLSARFGRWGTQSISTPMGKSPNDGWAARPYGNWGACDTQRDKFPGRGEETRTCYPTSRAPQGGRASPGGWK